MDNLLPYSLLNITNKKTPSREQLHATEFVRWGFFNCDGCKKMLHVCSLRHPSISLKISSVKGGDKAGD